MSYLVLLFPDVSESDFSLIQNFRKDHDTYHYDLVAPHFTMVFGVTNWRESDFVNEIQERAKGLNNIQFVLRRSILVKDDFSDFFHCFLVPQEGYEELVGMHDELYKAKLKSNLRADIKFIPHITVGKSLDRNQCQQMVDDWNDRNFEIEGTVTALTIIEHDNNQIRNIDVVHLNALSGKHN